jgi:long-subunit acyl-CoA synthetase (AMP-forming)
VDSGSLPQLDKLLKESHKPLLILLPDTENVESLRSQWPKHSFAGSNDLDSAESWREPEVRSSEIAYLLFTSGSTGIPKGVMVAHRNVAAFIEYMVER